MTVISLRGYSAEEIAVAWMKYRTAPASVRDRARMRLAILEAVSDLLKAGQNTDVAIEKTIANFAQKGSSFSASSLRRWIRRVRHVAHEHWLPFLLPGHGGGAALAPMPEEAWESLLAALASPELPSVESCYESLKARAHLQGWMLPSLRTIQRRIARMPLARPAMAGNGSLDLPFPRRGSLKAQLCAV